jgi:alkanesulfonate monooxygenase SsuD/methylene tetrahydromethanopterin reductase-like flavin-dependent oxidoreductase (luciferase family)
VKWQVEPEMAYDPSKVHKIDFEGEYLRCHAYFQTHPSPQRTPVIFQAGASKSGIDFAGKHAEAIYSDNLTFPSLTTYIKDVRAAAVKHGRDPYDVKIFVAIMPFLGATVEEAQAKYDKAKKLVSAQSGLAKICGFTGVDLGAYPYTEPFDLNLDAKDSAITGVVKNLNLRAKEAGVPFTPESLGKLTGFINTPAPIGTGEMVADVFQEWMEKTDVDGFNIVCKLAKHPCLCVFILITAPYFNRCVEPYELRRYRRVSCSRTSEAWIDVEWYVLWLIRMSRCFNSH